jgi:aspartyl/asparaginyl-tRNA synthetase
MYREIRANDIGKPCSKDTITIEEAKLRLDQLFATKSFVTWTPAEVRAFYKRQEEEV